MPVNPYKTQKKRLESAIKKIESAQESLALMGATYEEDGQIEHSEIVKTLFLTAEELKEALREFKGVM